MIYVHVLCWKPERVRVKGLGPEKLSLQPQEKALTWPFWKGPSWGLRKDPCQGFSGKVPSMASLEGPVRASLERALQESQFFWTCFHNGAVFVSQEGGGGGTGNPTTPLSRLNTLPLPILGATLGVCINMYNSRRNCRKGYRWSGLCAAKYYY